MRLFTFGCSFTNGSKPSWADILAKEFGYYQNWGRGGAGNTFIFHSLTECIRRNRIDQNDTVVVMWTSIAREDRWANGKWITPGTIYNQTVYNQDYVKKFADPTGYLIRDMAHLSAARQILDGLGCRYYFLSMVPFSVFDDNTNLNLDRDTSIIKLYSRHLDLVRPSIYETVFDNNWYSRKGIIDLYELEREYDILAGSDWPSWSDLRAGCVPRSVQKELDSLGFLQRLTIRSDTHPTPIEHLEYLDRVLPEIPVSAKTRQWTEQIDNQLRQLEPIAWRPNVPVRF